MQNVIAECTSGLQPDALLILLIGDEQAVFTGCLSVTQTISSITLHKQQHMKDGQDRNQ